MSLYGFGQRKLPHTDFIQRVQQGCRRRRLVRVRRKLLLAFFAGIRTNWTSVIKVKEGETTNDLFGFLTTEPNAEVGAIHPKAMPTILTHPAEIETWLTAPAEETLKLQCPLANGALRIVVTGVKKDEALEAAWQNIRIGRRMWRPQSGIPYATLSDWPKPKSWACWAICCRWRGSKPIKSSATKHERYGTIFAFRSLIAS